MNNYSEKFEQFKSHLNDQQILAATADLSHALVIAGAGCGKTKTLVARAAYLISIGVPSDKIQMLTFTRRAAKEMLDRVSGVMAGDNICAGTFHSWCMSIIKRSPETFGLVNHTIIDEDDQSQMMKICRGMVANKNFKMPTSPQLIGLMSFARNKMISLSEALQEKMPEIIGDDKQIAKVREVLKLYEEKKKSLRYIDYDDILGVISSAVNYDKNISSWISSFSQHVLIDEFQDTNPLQWSILEPISKGSVVYAVGDPRQSIYKFRGASIEVINNSRSILSNIKIFELNKNYRSTQEVLDLSNWLMSQSHMKYGEGLVSVRGKGIKPKIITCSDEMDEAHVVASEILSKNAKGFVFKDNMVLGRSLYSLRAVEASFLARKIPYNLYGGHSIFKSSHIKDILSVVRIAGNIRDEIAWSRFLCLHKGVGEISANEIFNEIAQCINFNECVDILSRHKDIPPRSLSIFNKISSLSSVSPGEVYEIAQDGLLPQLERIYENQNWESRKSDIKLIYDLAKKQDSIMSFLEEYVLSEAKQTNIREGTSEDCVTLATIHAMKGMEADFVYLVNMSPKSCPPAWAAGNIDETEEERRVLYVALTRAKEELILLRKELNSFSDKKYLYSAAHDGKTEVVEYFFNDLPVDYVIEELSQQKINSSKPDRLISTEVGKFNYGMNFN